MTQKKFCIDRVLPGETHRPHNTIGTAHLGRAGAISPKNKAWVNGSTIRIRFLGGTSEQHAMVREVAPQWTQYANLNFEFTEDNRAEIRVAFDSNDGAWSYLGIDNLRIPGNQATLNLGWVDQGVILHEFGHMIGLAHSHQTPFSGIQWNEEAVIRDLSGPPNYWDEATIRHNVLRKYEMDQINGTEFDPDSIMLYAFPSAWTIDGTSTHSNENLSELDKAFIQSAKMYPGRNSEKKGVTEIVIGQEVAAKIGQEGEQDIFVFDIKKPDIYRVETTGSMDSVLALFGPDSETLFIDENDDGGERLNARIFAQLDTGRYFAQVRHWNPIRKGEYAIKVTPV